MKIINNRWTLVGIVSYGDENCSGASGVYARVDYYYDWIQSQKSMATKTGLNFSTCILFNLFIILIL
jgi:secreted trypsin-like serine protease